MTRRHWTTADDDALRALYAAGEGVARIAVAMRRGKCTVHRHANRLGLVFNEKHRWTSDEDAILRARYPGEPTAAVAAAVGLPVNRVYQRAWKLGLHKTAAFFVNDKSGRVLRGHTDPRMMATQFEHGHATWNKGKKGWTAGGRSAETRFKKGARLGRASALYKPVGTERVSKDGYRERKVNDDLPLQSRWRAVHLIVWEAVNGPLPDSHCVIFRDGDKTNPALDNLQLISRADNMRRNSYHNYPQPIPQLIQLRGALTRKINNRQRKKA